MSLNKNIIDFAHFLADEAAKITLSYYGNKLEIFNKSSKDFDPVTEADKMTESLLRKLIKKEFPNHGIIGEEFDDTFIEGTPHWVIDPIDGTRAFILDAPSWGTLIAYNDGKKPILGIADLPAQKNRYIGYNNKSFKISEGKKSQVFAKENTNLDNCVISTTDPLLFNEKEFILFKKLALASSKRRFGLDCNAYCLMASGKIDLIIEPNLKSYDVQALIPIVEGSGGIISTWDGKCAYRGGNIIACSNKNLYSRVIKVIKDIL